MALFHKSKVSELSAGKKLGKMSQRKFKALFKKKEKRVGDSVVLR